MLLVSWLVSKPEDASAHMVTLYHIEMGSYNAFNKDNTTLNHYRFTALEPCSLYVVCVEIANTHSFTCLSTISGMNVFTLSTLKDIRISFSH